MIEDIISSYLPGIKCPRGNPWYLKWVKLNGLIQLYSIHFKLKIDYFALFVFMLDRNLILKKIILFKKVESNLIF